MSYFSDCFAAGYACLSAWADLLDIINVYPVTDGDTGTNLRISLAPLHNGIENGRATSSLLARCATGNSGNIAAAFFQEFCQAEDFPDLAAKAAAGRDKAWQAVARPCSGTMLTLFDRFASTLASITRQEHLYGPLSIALQDTVHASSEALPELKEAGVVDSGALAMYLFFDGFFRNLTGQNNQPASIVDIFDGKLAINDSFQPTSSSCYCVDLTLQANDQQITRKSITDMGQSVVIMENESTLKVHLHTPDPDGLKDQLNTHGDIVQWSSEKISQSKREQPAGTGTKTALHIMTDGAGSISRKTAGDYGITLLDSYITEGDNSRPESLCTPDQIYPLMRKGIKVTTAQASTFERHQHYLSVCQRFGRSLYLCVGSGFTGNYDAVTGWKRKNDPGDLLTVLDTGTASGRLGLITLLTARQSKKGVSPAELIEFAGKKIDKCEEYVFIDDLKYLVAGGRISKAASFFGNLLNIKPVISPIANEVRKIGIVHSRKGQLKFAMQRLSDRFDKSSTPQILLQYTDNEIWISKTVQNQVRDLLPGAEILITPLSLTSGVHMGPGTWSIAFASTI